MLLKCLAFAQRSLLILMSDLWILNRCLKSNQVRKLNSFTTYNPSLPDMDTLIKKYLLLLRSDENLKELFPAKAFNTIYRCNKNLKELLSPSLYPNRKSTKRNSIISYNSCDICKNYMVFRNMFTCTVTGKKYFVKVSYIVTPVMLYI